MVVDRGNGCWGNHFLDQNSGGVTRVRDDAPERVVRPY